MGLREGIEHLTPNVGVWKMLRRSTIAIGRAPRIRTGPLPRLPSSALSGARTLESVTLPGAILLAFAALATIQVVLTW